MPPPGSAYAAADLPSIQPVDLIRHAEGLARLYAPPQRDGGAGRIQATSVEDPSYFCEALVGLGGGRGGTAFGPTEPVVSQSSGARAMQSRT